MERSLTHLILIPSYNTGGKVEARNEGILPSCTPTPDFSG